MNFMDADKIYGLSLGIFFLICIGAVIVGTAVTSEQRSHSGKSAFPFIFGVMVVALAGWMFIDYTFLPQYKNLPFKQFSQMWFQKHLG